MSQLFYNYPVEEFLTLDPSNTTGSPYNNMILTIEQKIPKEFENLMDVKNELYGDLLDMGVIDPMKVTKHALQNAVSVATTILSTNAIITMARTFEANETDK